MAENKTTIKNNKIALEIPFSRESNLKTRFQENWVWKFVEYIVSG